jgi:hypothetical protein
VGKKKHDLVIAVDPDIDKSGICVLSPSTRQLILKSLPFPVLVDFIKEARERYKGIDIVVIVEAGWLNEKSNFHKARGKSSERIAKYVGRNQQTGILLLQMCEHIGIPCEEVKPLTKHWKGDEGKITHEELSYIVGPLPKRTNQDQRDATILAWWYADLPIKIKTW